MLTCKISDAVFSDKQSIGVLLLPLQNRTSSISSKSFISTIAPNWIHSTCHTSTQSWENYVHSLIHFQKAAMLCLLLNCKLVD